MTDVRMPWARTYGCTFEGCDSLDVWILIESNDSPLVAVLCQEHTRLMAELGERYPVEKVRYVLVGSDRVGAVSGRD